MAPLHMLVCLRDFGAFSQSRYTSALRNSGKKHYDITNVNVLRGWSDGIPSTSMYDLGVTIAGFKKRKKKKLPINVQMTCSLASGYLR